MRLRLEREVMAALQALRANGVVVEVIGSFAQDTMRGVSDVDCLVADLGEITASQAHRILAAHVRSAPYDLTLERELPPDLAAAIRLRTIGSASMSIVFLDCEFSDFVHLELLSLGMVTLDGTQEHYVELDLETEAGRARREASSDFVRYGGVLDLWGRVPAATCSEEELGRRTGQWLLERADQFGQPLSIAYDYSTDYELMEYAVRDAGLWAQVRQVVRPLNVASLTRSRDGELAAERCFAELAGRGLGRHHALGDALALRAAYLAVEAGEQTSAEAP